MKKAPVLSAFTFALLAGCGKKTFDYCDDMNKTGREIEALQARNVALKEKMDAVPEGTDSTGYLRFGYQKEMDKNNEQIVYLKTYNQTSAANCIPAGKEPAAGGNGSYR